MASASFPILFLAPERVDDAILGSGLVRRLLDEIPHARFTVVCSDAVAPLFRDLPVLDRTLSVEPARSLMHWLGLWRRLRGRRWGLILDLRGSSLPSFLPARRRAVKKPANPALEPVHKVRELARVLKIEEEEPPAPFLYVGPETEAKAAKLLKPPRGAEETPILAMAPAADWVGKAWPAERFAVVAAELLGPSGPLPNGRLMLVGDNADRWATETVRRAIARDRLIDLVGKVDLLTAFACLRQARLFIGSDNPFQHLAAAAGAPTIGLFGPSDERVYAPWGEWGRVVRGPRSFETFKTLDPTLSQAMNHMQDLAVAKVVAAARLLLEETKPDTAVEA